MNIIEMRDALSDLADMRKQRDKLGEKLDFLSSDERLGDLKEIKAIIIDVWVSVPIEVAEKLFASQFQKQEQLCIKRAAELGIDHETFVRSEY